jgi:heptosyltransferase-2
MATPALRALRRRFPSARITFLGSSPVRQILSPSPFCDEWIDLRPSFLHNLRLLRKQRFQTCILMKNSFRSALTAALAGIPERLGYARDGRTLLLSRPIQPLKDSSGHFVPIPAIDYYLQIARSLGAEDSDRTMELPLDPANEPHLHQTLSSFFSHTGPKVILVPGGAFGPSKCWPPERFAQVADILIEEYHTAVLLSVAPNKTEMEIANVIRRKARNPLLCSADASLNLADIKTLIARADLVITNDTGPRHIAIALKRKVITLFGPNNPQWTQTGWSDEIQIIGQGPCVPCDKPICRQPRHYCMESITVEQVLDAVRRIWKETHS